MGKRFFSLFGLFLILIMFLFSSSCSRYRHFIKQNEDIKRDIVPWSIFIYMNGSDLESEWGAGTADIEELLTVPTDNVNIVLLTGGAKKWHNNTVNSFECAIWRIDNGMLNKVKSIGSRSMGKPETLSEFINFGIKNYPSDKTGLILWDHGNGAAGFGLDEIHSDTTLTLNELNEALSSGLEGKKLEFIGFDACLMATVETAVAAANHAHYLIASEDLEPNDGWDYRCLNALNNDISALELGIAIADSFFDYYVWEDTTLSVTDLSKIHILSEIIDKNRFGQTAFENEKWENVHKTIGAKSFGESGMVDIADIARKLDLPEVLAALDNVVVYNIHNSKVKLGGLSIYLGE